MLELIPIQTTFWKIATKLPGIFLRWHFSAERLARLVYIDLQPRHEPAAVDLGQNPQFRLFLQVINLSPYSIKLDQANICFHFRGSDLKSFILEKRTYAPGVIEVIFCQENIDGTLAAGMENLAVNNGTWLSGNFEFTCKVRSFSKKLERLDGINPRVQGGRPMQIESPKNV